MRIVRLCIVLGSLSLIGLAQNQTTLTTNPKDTARPVSALLDQLRKRERISVTYEDPRYSKRADMDEKPAEFSYIAEEFHAPYDTEATVARMLRQYGASGGLTFAVVQDGMRLHVVPSETFDSTGQRVRQDSILDTVISVPSGRRTTSQLLQLICDEVKKETGYQIDVGPSDPTTTASTNQAVDHQTARAAIGRLLDSLATPGAFVWDLYYDPADRTYGLNFSYVGPAAAPAQKPVSH
ncbi:MAG TPA: hypothetical protein VMU61_00185 [Candidatus Aquilonibacter sp.]|nr:hypothetical protein [Candidatus Aquilonibacter sp.]